MAKEQRRQAIKTWRELTPSLQAPGVLPTKPDAIRKYQRFHNLPSTGMLDPRTSKHMRGRNVRPGQAPAPRRPRKAPNPYRSWNNRYDVS
jgi:Putative peptidoglycan binding domain